jgi:hypothetical protein
LVGVITEADGGTLVFEGVLTDSETFRFRVEGLKNAVLTIDGQPRATPVELAPGTYKVVLRWSAK